MSKTEWHEGTVRPTLPCRRLKHFGLACFNDSVSVTHIQTGFSAHKSESYTECAAVAEAIDDLPGWDKITLAADGKTLEGVDKELMDKAAEIRKQVISPKGESVQASLS